MVSFLDSLTASGFQRNSDKMRKIHCLQTKMKTVKHKLINTLFAYKQSVYYKTLCNTYKIPTIHKALSALFIVILSSLRTLFCTSRGPVGCISFHLARTYMQDDGPEFTGTHK